MDLVDITIIPQNLANQIAAGEVIERPASVVKELVENSLDAEASQIDIKIEEAGMKTIEVIDNGKGIKADELEIAFERHATSKIFEKEDLFRVKTLGFRGEALPSIASVSELAIESSIGEGAGRMLEVKGGEIIENKPASSRQGTMVRVSNLFFNTPARLKHIKSISTELSHITDTVNRFALAHPDVIFRLHNDGHIAMRTFGNGDLRQAIAGVYGVDVARNMVEIEAENLNYEVSGYISKPDLTRATNSYITLVINGRVIKNYRLSKAIQTGYGSKLMINRHPFAVCHITLDPLLVDVNVHPTKQEVRISEEDDLATLLKQAVNEALQEIVRIPEALQENKSINNPNKLKPEQATFNFSYQKQEDSIVEEDFNYSSKEKENDFEKEKETVKTRAHHLEESALETVKKRKNKSFDQKDEERRFPVLDYIGQAHGTYLIAQNENGIYFIDQHAAQERIKYEYYREEIGKSVNHQQQLLIPIVLEYPQDEFLIIEEHKNKLKDVGIDLEPFGSNTYILKSHPSWFIEGQEEGTAREMIDFFLKERKISLKAFREATAIMMSCKRSIKANHYLNRHEAEKLIYDLSETENPYNCPHGRPVLVQFTNYQMERLFKRVQDSN